MANSTPDILLYEAKRELLLTQGCIDSARQLIERVPLYPNPRHTEWVLKRHAELVREAKTHTKRARQIRRMHKKAMKAAHRGQHVLTNKEKN